MKLSEFQQAVVDEFGPDFGRVLVQDTVIAALDDRTASAALAAGVPARDVWMALCRVQGVPVERRHGAGRPHPRG